MDDISEDISNEILFDIPITWFTGRIFKFETPPVF